MFLKQLDKPASNSILNYLLKFTSLRIRYFRKLPRLFTFNFLYKHGLIISHCSQKSIVLADSEIRSALQSNPASGCSRAKVSFSVLRLSVMLFSFNSSFLSPLMVK